MNSSRCFSLLLVGLLLTTGVAGAVTVSESDAPDSAAVGSQITAQFTLTELYTDPSYEEWTLRGRTNLTAVTWTVTAFDQANNRIEQQSFDGDSFEYGVALSENVATVEVRVSGTVPEVEEWSYDPPQQFTIAAFRQTRQGGTSNEIGEPTTFRPYTEASQEARDAIASAEAAIGGNEEARAKLQQAIEAYEEANFDLAADLAGEAESIAESSRQRSRTIQLALIVLVALLAIGGVVGAAFWYRSNRTGSKL